VIKIDLENNKVIVEENNQEVTYEMSSKEAFDTISKAWIRCGWDNKYVYSFAWLGRPIIQLPEDMIRIQEVIYDIQPDVIVETGIAHGGSLVFYAGLCKAMEKGRVVGIDIEIRPPNRKAIEEHLLFPYIELIEGSSVDVNTYDQVKQQIKENEKVIVFLDSCHTKGHVLQELELYSKLVSVGSYIVAMDGIMGEVVGAPRTEPNWIYDNPTVAAEEFVKNNPNFVIEEPKFPFNEGNIEKRVTYWPGAFIKRIK